MEMTRLEVKKRNPMVDIWRMVFAVSVVLYHTRYLPWCSEQHLLFRSGTVDFFFILSGFLMAQSIMRRKEQPCQRVGNETISFIFSKIKRIFPVFLFAFLMDIVIRVNLTRQGIAESPIYYIWDILFLRATGLCGYSGSTTPGAAWYLHAMFLAMAILFPLARKYSDVFRNILAPLLTVLIYGWFCNVHGNIYFTLGFTNGICLGLLRAFAGICLGVVCHSLCLWLQRQRMEESRLFCAVITAVELACFGGALWIARHYEHSRTDFVVIFLLAVGLTCSFCGYSALLRLAGRIPTAWIEKYSLSLYLNHYVWVSVLSDWKLPLSFGWQAAIFLILSALSALVCVWTLELAARIWKYLQEDWS